MTKNKSDLALIFTIFFLLLALGVSLILVRQRQIIQKQAAGDTVHLSLAPDSANPSLNGSLSLKIWLNTQTRQIKYVKVVVNFDKTKLNIDSPIVLTAKDHGLGTEVFPVTTPQEANSNGSIRIILANPPGVTMPNGAIEFATLPFKAIAAGSTQVTFDAAHSQIVQDDNQAMIITSASGTYDVGGGATPTPTPTGGVTGTPTPTLTPTVTPTPTGGITPTPTGAPSISRMSNYCGKPLETILTIYGADFGATKGESKVYFRYKASAIAENTTYKEAVADIISWTNTIVFAKVPEVDFGNENKVVSKVKLVKQGYTDSPANFPPGEVAFFSISKDAARNIGDLDCNNAVNFEDFAILFNNWSGH